MGKTVTWHAPVTLSRPLFSGVEACVCVFPAGGGARVVCGCVSSAGH